MSLIHACRCWSALLSLSVYFLCVVVSAKKGEKYIFKFQTCSKYVRLIVPNEIMNLNRKKIDAKFSFPAHHILGKFVLKLSPLLAGIFYCLYNFKTIKNSSGHLKCTATFTMQLMQLFPPQNPRRICFQLLKRRLLVPREIAKQYNFVGNTNCIIDSYIEHRLTMHLF